MALAKKLFLTTLFVAAGGFGYTILSSKPKNSLAQNVTPDTAIAETDKMLYVMGLEPVGLARLTIDQPGKDDEYCVLARKQGTDTEVEACFTLTKGGHPRLASLNKF